MYQMNTYGVFSECAEPLEYTPEQGKDIQSWNYEKVFSSKVRVPEPTDLNYEREIQPLYIECETE